MLIRYQTEAQNHEIISEALHIIYDEIPHSVFISTPSELLNIRIENISPAEYLEIIEEVYKNNKIDLVQYCKNTHYVT